MRKLPYQWAGVGILFLIGLGVDMIPGVTSWWPASIIWGLASIWLIVIIFHRIKHRKAIEQVREETTDNNLTGILTKLHKQMMFYRTERLRQKIDRKLFIDTIPILYDKLGLVNASNWDNFKKNVDKRIKRQIPKSPQKLRQKNWYYNVTGKAAEIRKELVESKNWGINDVTIVGNWLDSNHIGLAELRDRDNSEWQKLYEKLHEFMSDSILDRLIEKHILYSYTLSSISLFLGYSDKLPNSAFYQFLHDALRDSSISPSMLTTELNKILRKIENRQEELRQQNNEHENNRNL